MTQPIPGGDSVDRRKRQDQRLDKRLLILYLVTLVIFALLAWRSEINNRDIDRNTHRLAVAVWSNCDNLNTRAGIVNNTNRETITFLSNITPPPPGLPALVAVYQAGIIAIRSCGPKP